MNEIFIRGLAVEVFIGVPDEERAKAQKILIDVTIEPLTPFDDLGDDLNHTVDYDTAARMIVSVATERPRRLIETLAADLTEMLLTEFPVRQASVEIRKFILPNTDHVAVRHTRQR
jgi:7,8-dihydroneopterin aldolase/epimerase/oxygenase